MANIVAQRGLNPDSIANFYHDLFVQSQAEDFAGICAPLLKVEGVVSDMGGGCGFFASAISRDVGARVRVVDADPVSVMTAKEAGLEAIEGDVLEWNPVGDESVACFNLILHHLVGPDEDATRRLQMLALERWRHAGVHIFINEYIYDSYFANLSGALIYQITSNRLLSSIARSVSRIVPSLRANTFGVGVRFRAESEWRKLFQSNGWRVLGHSRGSEERVSLARRFLLIRSCRRDSFVLLAQ